MTFEVPPDNFSLSQPHLLSIDKLNRADLVGLLGLADRFATENATADTIVKSDSLKGKIQINLFFESSTRTQASFELAGKRLSADVMNMSVKSSSVNKGETLLDTALTLNAMKPDLLVVRHHAAGAVELLAQKMDCNVINGGDGGHQHPTQALLDALTIYRNKGKIEGLTVAICGDVRHSRVARSNIQLLGALNARVRIIAPHTLQPTDITHCGAEVYSSMEEGLKDSDVVMMLRLQQERMNGAFIPSLREYFHFFGLDRAKLAFAKPDAIIMHPGPMNRGVEIDSRVVNDERSVIYDQVEMGLAVRMAVLQTLPKTRPPAQGAIL